jgi:hypothetical protein
MILSSEKDNSLIRASRSVLRPNVWVPKATGPVKENVAVLWANDGKWSYPGLGFERGWVGGSR